MQKNNNTYFTTSYAMLVLKLLLFHDNKTKMYSPFNNNNNNNIDFISGQYPNGANEVWYGEIANDYYKQTGFISQSLYLLFTR